MSLPPSHSLFWRLALLQIGFCLSMIWLSQSWTQYVRDRSSYLPSETRVQLLQFAADAERSWRDGGREGVHRWQGHSARRKPPGPLWSVRNGFTERAAARPR